MQCRETRFATIDFSFHVQTVCWGPRKARSEAQCFSGNVFTCVWMLDSLNIFPPSKRSTTTTSCCGWATAGILKMPWYPGVVQNRYLSLQAPLHCEAGDFGKFCTCAVVFQPLAWCDLPIYTLYRLSTQIKLCVSVSINVYVSASMCMCVCV